MDRVTRHELREWETMLDRGEIPAGRGGVSDTIQRLIASLEWAYQELDDTATQRWRPCDVIDL